MTVINITEESRHYTMTEDGYFGCNHFDYTIIKACCPSGSLVECGCGGLDMIVCENKECTGITEEDAYNLFGGESQ